MSKKKKYGDGEKSTLGRGIGPWDYPRVTDPFSTGNYWEDGHRISGWAACFWRLQSCIDLKGIEHRFPL